MNADRANRPAARVIPVIDVMGGQVVRAVGGRRELYAPIRSQLTESTEPAAVAEALLAAAGGNELYVADIDALQRHRPRLGWLAPLAARGVKFLVDAGIRTTADAKPILDAGATTVIAGTETLHGLAELANLVAAIGPERVILSLDLRNGAVVGDETVWEDDPDPLALIGGAVLAGVRRVLVLELARVGTGIGPGTTELCEQLRATHPDIELIAGGGVRSWADVHQLTDAGVNGVLVASALHDGNLTRAG